MDRSRFLAGLIGPTLAVISVGLLLNLARLPELVDQLSDGWALIMIAGVATLLSGLAVVLSHNVWKGWPAIITAFGCWPSSAAPPASSSPVRSPPSPRPWSRAAAR